MHPDGGAPSLVCLSVFSQLRRYPHANVLLPDGTTVHLEALPRRARRCSVPPSRFGCVSHHPSDYAECLSAAAPYARCTEQQTLSVDGARAQHATGNARPGAPRSSPDANGFVVATSANRNRTVALVSCAGARLDTRRLGGKREPYSVVRQHRQPTASVHSPASGITPTCPRRVCERRMEFPMDGGDEGGISRRHVRICHRGCCRSVFSLIETVGGRLYTTKVVIGDHSISRFHATSVAYPGCSFVRTAGPCCSPRGPVGS